MKNRHLSRFLIVFVVLTAYLVFVTDAVVVAQAVAAPPAAP